MDNNLGDPANTVFVLFFCDAMHPGTCRHCKNSVSKAQTEEFIASVDYNYHQHWLDIHIKSGGFALLGLEPEL